MWPMNEFLLINLTLIILPSKLYLSKKKTFCKDIINGDG